MSNGDRHDLSIYPSLFSRDPSLLFDTDFNPCRDFGLTSLYLFLRILTVQYLKDFSSSLSVNHLFPCHSRFVTYAISISLQIFLPVERKRWSSNLFHFLMLRGWFLKILQKIQTFFAINKIAQKKINIYFIIFQNSIWSRTIIIFKKYYF